MPSSHWFQNQIRTKAASSVTPGNWGTEWCGILEGEGGFWVPSTAPMPQFHAFGRKWFFASDDLPFVAIWGCLFHAVGAILLGLVALLKTPENCKAAEQVHYFILCLLGSFIASVVLSGMCIRLGLRGKSFPGHQTHTLFSFPFWCTLHNRMH